MLKKKSLFIKIMKFALCLVLGATTYSCGNEGSKSSSQTKITAEFSIDENLPSKISGLGIYTDPPNFREYNPRLIEYKPQHELWTNNSVKQRFIYIPEGSKIDTQNPEHFKFPVGSAVFKTFSYPDENQKIIPIETRILLGTENGWKTAVYEWNKSGTEASLRDLSESKEILIETRNHSHTIPDELQCRQCHEGGQSFILGFDRRQLSDPIELASTKSQLQDLFDKQIFSDPVEDAEPIQTKSKVEQQVIGYLYGNCRHCHNSRKNILDLSPEVAVSNLVNQRIQGVLLPTGYRISSGNPHESRLFQAMTSSSYQPMPPLGINIRDEEFLKNLQEWIESL